jgi:hypothetical protein
VSKADAAFGYDGSLLSVTEHQLRSFTQNKENSRVPIHLAILGKRSKESQRLSSYLFFPLCNPFSGAEPRVALT